MNLLFNASAGTGKTWQVTNLYLALVLGRPFDGLPKTRAPVDPSRILLATFTDNASAELRGRVRAGLLSAEQQALGAGDDQAAARARQVLRTLPAAKICTLHAFCAGLLKDQALKQGLCAGFETLADDERELLLEQILSAEILAHLKTDPDFRTLCAGLNILGRSDHSLRSTLRLLIDQAADRGIDLRGAEERLAPTVHTVDRSDFEAIYAELSAASSDLPSTALHALDALRAALEQYPDPDPFDRIPKFGRSKKWKPLSDELALLCERFCTERRYERHIEEFRAFARCLSGAAAAFADAKRARDVVDFGDQLLFARDRLQRGRDTGPLFEWIIIDEVQDISRVQHAIINALWSPQTHLVVCGDPKQSIYAWRSADPDVMSDLDRDIKQRPDPVHIPLRKSYRSKDRLLDGVNVLFREVFGAPYAAEALEPVAEIGALTAGDGEGPCIELLLPAGDEENPLDAEMRAVARRIRLLVDGSDEWRPRTGYDEMQKRFRPGVPVRYSDILILLRRTACQPLLEQALRSEGVPFSHGGKGRALFAQQEVRDLLLFLQAVCDPFNDIALAGYLRSPLGGLRDAELVELGWDGETFRAETLRARLSESGLPAAERLERFRALTGELAASQLVRDAVRETAYDAYLTAQPGGEQMLANMKKAIDWLRATERGGSVLLPETVRRFEQVVDAPPRSGAAEAMLPDPDQNAVTLMTVHGAKGLTRRVCFLPDICFGRRNEPGFAFWSKDGRLEMTLAQVDQVKCATPGRKEAAEADRAVRDLEEAHLFYVAMTRARDLTVLSCSKTDPPRGWLKLAGDTLLEAPSDWVRQRQFDDLPPSPEAKRPVQTGEEKPMPGPVRVPSGWTRRPVTSLCDEPPQRAPVGPAPTGGDAAQSGTLAHAVLEEMATTHWRGDAERLLNQLSGEFPSCSGNREELLQRIEAACRLLHREMGDALSVQTEFPFVYREGDLILDGAIDLLVRLPDHGWMVLDYKFSAEQPDVLMARYAPQLQIYRRAIHALHPGDDVAAALLHVPPDAIPALLALPDA